MLCIRPKMRGLADPLVLGWVSEGIKVMGGGGGGGGGGGVSKVDGGLGKCVGAGFRAAVGVVLLGVLDLSWQVLESQWNTNIHRHASFRSSLV